MNPATLKSLPRRKAFMLMSLLLLAVSLVFAQQKSGKNPSPAPAQDSWGAIESPENTDFWEALNSYCLPPAAWSSPVKTAPAPLAQDQPSAPQENTQPRAAQEVSVNEYGRFEFHDDDAVQGSAGGTVENLDPEACGGGPSGTK